MKTLKNLLLVLLLICTGTATYSQSNIVDEIIKKNTGQDGISEVEISKKMFRLMLSNSANPVTKELINNFESLTILVNETSPFQNPSLLDLKVSLDENTDYERLMYMKEDDETIALYTKVAKTSNENNMDKILHFILLSKDNSEEIIMSIKGNLTLKEIFTVSAMLNYDLSNIVPFR